MKCTVIDGCDRNILLHKQVIDKTEELLAGNKSELKWIQLDNHPLHYCRGCDYCQFVNPGICSIDDGQNEILEKYINSDVVVILTPVEFGCCDSQVKNFIDRTEPLFLPIQVKKDGSTVMKGRYANYPTLIFVGIKENASVDCMRSFSDFAQKSNLACASSHTKISLITKETDIDALEMI